MGSLGVLVIFLAVFMTLLPTLINIEPIRRTILANISEVVGGRVASRRFDLSFLPRPYVTIYQASLSIPGKVSANLASLTIHPRILPLLGGDVRLASVKAKDLNLTVEVQEESLDKAEEKLKPFSLSAIQDRTAAAFAVLGSKAPGLVVHLENGQCRFGEERQPVFEFRGVQASMDDSAKGVNLDVLGFRLRADRLRHLQRTGADGLPQGTRHETDETGGIRGRRLKATFRVDNQSMVVSLKALDLDDPQIDIIGELALDHRSPQVTLELEGRDADVDSTRKAALALAGDRATIRRIFNIVKGGQAPRIHFRAHGDAWHDLEKGENILITGSMLDGKVFVPSVNLDLEAVKGDVIIARNILEGSHLEARMGSIEGREGTLKVGFRGKDGPFHLDMLMHADLAQLHPILKRLVSNQSFAQELNFMNSIEGYGRGKLVLGESRASIKTRLDLSEFDLAGYYERIPYPVQISGRDCVYDERTLHVRQLSGKLGKSSFSDVSFSLDWEKEPYLEVKSPGLEVYLGELYSWLVSLDLSKAYLEDFKRVDGMVSLSELRLKGPLSKPDAWQWRTKGNIKHLAADTSLLPARIEILGGSFHAVEDATEQRLSFKDAHLTMLDASLSVSGVLGGFLRGLNETDVSLQGKMGRAATQWVSDGIGLPTAYHIRPPVSISEGHLVRDRGTKTSFAGDLIAENGPRLSLDILRNPGELMIKKLLVEDGDSQASLKLDQKDKNLSLEFAGHLTKATMDKLLVKNQFCHGWIKGHLGAQILLDRRTISRAQGELEGEDLLLPFDLKVPLSVESLSLNAMKDHLTVESGALTWGGTRMALGGSVKLLPDGVVLDMDLSADNLEWDQVEAIMGREERKEDGAQGDSSWNLPVRGSLRLKTESFKYDQFTWSPLLAHVSFAHNGVEVAITEANLCGISTPGTLSVSPEGLRLDFKTVSNDQDLAPTLTCLGDKKGLVTGKFDLKGAVTSGGGTGGLLKSLRGDLEFLANDGRIYRHGLLAKIFAFLNVAGIFKGEIPDITQEGFPYDAMKAKGRLQNGKLVLTEGHINSPSMEIACQGDIDLIDKELDLQYLVAPLKTVDLVVKKIPLVSDVLNGTLVSIPVKATGPWADPKITALSPSSVGSGLLGIMKKTFQLPFKIIGVPQEEEKPK